MCAVLYALKLFVRRLLFMKDSPVSVLCNSRMLSVFTAEGFVVSQWHDKLFFSVGEKKKPGKGKTFSTAMMDK